MTTLPKLVSVPPSGIIGWLLALVELQPFDESLARYTRQNLSCTAISGFVSVSDEPHPAIRMNERGYDFRLLVAHGPAHRGNCVREAHLGKPPDRWKPFDDCEFLKHRFQPMGVVKEQHLLEVMRHSIALPSRGKPILGIVFADKGIVHDASGISDQLPFRVVERNGDAAGQEPFRAISQAEFSYDGFFEPSLVQIRMIEVEVLQFEVKRGVDDDVLGRIVVAGVWQFPLLGVHFGTARVRLLCLLRLEFRRDEPFLKDESRLSSVQSILGVQLLHEHGEVNEVPFGTAAEALEYAFDQICRKGFRILLSFVVRQGTEAVMLVASYLEFDAVMPEHVSEFKLLAQFPEVNPFGHINIPGVEGWW